MIGVPSLSVTQPGRRGEPTRMANRILLPAIAEVAASKSMGASWRGGGGGAGGVGAGRGFRGEGGTTAGPAPAEEPPPPSLWGARVAVGPVAAAGRRLCAASTT